MVVAVLHETLLQITAGSALAAAAAAQYWRDTEDVLAVEWFLRDDLVHQRPVLLFTRDRDGVVHATVLVAGKPVSQHPATCCGTPLRWDVLQVCSADLAEPCPDCRTALSALLRTLRCEAGSPSSGSVMEGML